MQANGYEARLVPPDHWWMASSFHLVAPEIEHEEQAMKVKLSEITDAIDFTDQYTEYFLDKETGEIVYVNDMMMTSSEKKPIYDLLDEHGFFRLPDQREIDDYRTLKNYVGRTPIICAFSIKCFRWELERTGLS